VSVAFDWLFAWHALFLIGYSLYPSSSFVD
jgi:hypothetical protein